MSRSEFAPGILLAVFLSSQVCHAVEPADPDLIPEAHQVLDYVVSVQGKGILTGISRYGGGAPAVLHRTGREPAVYGTDIYGFHEKFGETYHSVVRRQVEDCKRWWNEKGGIVQLHYHWGLPGDPNGSAWGDKKRKPIRLDWRKAITPGTKEHTDVIGDLSVTADYLKQLADASVPVLWRPLHEIDGGWFWWTDKENPENTAELFRMVFDYLVKERGIHNLIWVYNAAHVTGAMRRNKEATFGDHVAYRKRFYPGDACVDIVTIDTYKNEALGWGEPWADSRQKAYDLMAAVAPGKPLAIGEDHVLCNPDIAQKDGPPWLWSLAWFSDCKRKGWMEYTFNHEYMLTLDELPVFGGRNVTPNVRITEPADGTDTPAGTITVVGMASDRNANLSSVSVHDLPGPWRNWALRSDNDVMETFPATTLLGEVEVKTDGSWTFVWQDAPVGYHNLVALARDSGGAAVCSNAVRVLTGVKNLARGCSLTASAKAKSCQGPEAAVDGDLGTAWFLDKTHADEQWLMLDLGTEREVSAVNITWSKAYARTFAVQIPDPFEGWLDLVRVENKRNFFGDSDILPFEPVTTRTLRLSFEKRAVNWGGYNVREIGVYSKLPCSEQPPATGAPGRGRR